MAKHTHTQLAQAVEARQAAVAARLRELFREWARSMAKKVARRLPAEKVVKGDLPGHEFHGNQWTDVGTVNRAEPQEGERRTELGFVGDTKAASILAQAESNAPEWRHGFQPEKAAVVSFDDVRALQPYVYQGQVEAYQKPGATADQRAPLAFHSGGKYYIINGTHRAEAVKANGSKTVNLRVIDIDEKHAPNYKLQRIAKASHATEALVAEILSSLGLDAFGQDVVDEISDELEAMHQRASRAGLAQVRLTPTDEIVNHLDAKAQEYVASRGAELVGKKVLEDGSVIDNPSAKWSIADTTRDDLRAVITDGVEQGWSSKFLADAIESSGAFDESRALMIARTELAYAHVEGNVEGWRASGEVTGKRSLLGDLHDVPDECDDNADAGVIDFEDDFPSGDAFPPYHPNCVCDVVPVLQGEEA